MTRQALLNSIGFMTLTFSLFAHAPIATAEQVPSTKGTHEFFRLKTQKMTVAELADVKTLADWRKLEPVHRMQIFDMLGLSPRPPKTNVKPFSIGTVAGLTKNGSKLGSFPS